MRQKIPVALTDMALSDSPNMADTALADDLTQNHSELFITLGVAYFTTWPPVMTAFIPG